jgi:hypothetical protein
MVSARALRPGGGVVPGGARRVRERWEFVVTRVDVRAAPSNMRAARPSGEMVDAADSKSVARESVLVRVRPGAPSDHPTMIEDIRKSAENKDI